MRIAIFGATSQIAKDLIPLLAADRNHTLVLYARRPTEVSQWLKSTDIVHRCVPSEFRLFDAEEKFDAIFNFVGVGDPKQALAMGADIFEVTQKYDDIALSHVRLHPTCRYFFLSSGAAYGQNFYDPVNQHTKAFIDINHLKPHHWYGVAKMYAECRHRASPNLPIVDLRIFNYFSHTQNIEAGFLITDAFRAIRDQTVLNTSKENIVRDYLHPSDFHQLVQCLLSTPASNHAYDCYSLAPVSKFVLLDTLKHEFGLQYQVVSNHAGIQATGDKSNYYSCHRELEHMGYRPAWSSLDGVVDQGKRLLALL